MSTICHKTTDRHETQHLGIWSEHESLIAFVVTLDNLVLIQSWPMVAVVIVYNTGIMNINITVWPALTDNYFMFPANDRFSITRKKRELI